jgi:hypothetical protein
MWMGIRKASGPAMLLCLATLGLTACGSSEESTTTARPAVSSATADRLARLSNRIASELGSGDVCHAAHAADDLQKAIQESDLPANLRPGVDAVAGDLVDQVNCPPPPAPPPPAPPPREPQKKPQKPKQGQGDQGKGKGGGGEEHGQPEHGGLAPPGQAKLKGEQG